MAMATGAMAQMHEAMKFAGASKLNVATTEIGQPSDTVSFAMTNMTSADITLPEMKGMSTIPSFTIKGVAFEMGADHVVSIPAQAFSSTVNANGEEKAVKGTSISGTYDGTNNSLTLTAVFTYGAMPLPMTYTVTSYYVKPVTSAITVVVGGSFTYSNPSVTYHVRKYTEDGEERLDVEVPQYKLDGTVMGDLTLGSYIIKGLTYDEARGGYYRDYKDDGLSFHFTAEQNGTKTMDSDYAFNSSKDNNVLVSYADGKIKSIVNTFQMGAMPFGIVTRFDIATTGVKDIHAAGDMQHGGAVYNLNGQRVSPDAKGLVIMNGKKIFRK